MFPEVGRQENIDRKHNFSAASLFIRPSLSAPKFLAPKSFNIWTIVKRSFSMFSTAVLIHAESSGRLGDSFNQ